MTVHSWRLYSVVPLENQGDGTRTQYSTESHYPALSYLCMLSGKLGRDKYQLVIDLTSLGIETISRMGSLRSTDSATAHNFIYSMCGRNI